MHWCNIFVNGKDGAGLVITLHDSKPYPNVSHSILRELKNIGMGFVKKTAPEV